MLFSSMSFTGANAVQVGNWFIEHEALEYHSSIIIIFLPLS